MLGSKSIRVIFAFAAAVAVSASGMMEAKAQADYPNKPVRLIVVYPPGGSTDIVARIVAPKLSQALNNVPVVVENKGGANGAIGTSFVAKSAPDGYTLLLTSTSPLVINPHTFSNLPYNTIEDFVGVSAVASDPHALAVNPGVGAKNLKELLKIAEKRDISIGSSGAGGQAHLAIEALKIASKAKITHVPYRGAGPAITDLLGGHLDAVVVDLAPLYPFIVSDKLRAITTTDTMRTSFMPQVPSSIEDGFPSFIAVTWMGVLAPAKTPVEIVNKLHKALTGIADNKDLIEEYAKLALKPYTMSSPAEFQKFLKDEYDRWGKIAKESGARAE